ncbi:Uncharacterised protein [Candidatus Bilamarchaeum dharawalense]|uniref:Uncharacterized protein n=1 Tax=Candidatus Bilamarchaeum dharawalense TaxID=2885759 RepID=A0A5E4LVC0_9ARCH|nr:Uncharacterised protein [Candidatus Bilamarchaeum dharawalense]
MIKRPKISKEEIIADGIYLFVGALAAFIAIFIFDIHWSFYPGETILPPSRHIFQTLDPYYFGIPLGAIIGFFVLKLVYFAFVEDEIAHHIFKGKKK